MNERKLKTKKDIFIFEDCEPLKKGTVCSVTVHNNENCFAVIESAYIVPAFQFHISELEENFDI